jgi:hypothetical protein
MFSHPMVVNVCFYLMYHLSSPLYPTIHERAGLRIAFVLCALLLSPRAPLSRHSLPLAGAQPQRKMFPSFTLKNFLITVTLPPSKAISARSSGDALGLARHGSRH